MDVTRANFAEVLPLVKKSIEEADFMAVDGEFTGISSNENFHSDNCYDTLEERYARLLRGSTDFLLLQFGLSTFKFNKRTSKYESNSFNFYLFPVPFSRQAPDCKFLCQASSIDFLVSQGFDFNKTFKEGISYLSLQDEMRMRLKLQQRHLTKTASASPAFTSPSGIANSAPIKSPAVVPDEQKGFLKASLDGIKKFLTNSKETNLDLPPCSAFQRKLLYQTAGLEFGSKIFLETMPLNTRERYIRVNRINGESDMKRKELQRQASEKGEIDNAVGFSKVIKLISKSGKLIVGHNMYLDLVHILHQFHVPLPEQYEQFKSALNCLFPQVCDTKLMSSMHPFKEQIPMTVLNDLNKHLSVKPFKSIKIAENSDATNYEMDDTKLHQAGYDAYITGLCFIRMANYLGSFQTPVKHHVKPNSDLLKPFINKVFIMKIADIPYMDIVGTDLKPTRDNVFHVTIHENRHWTYSDVRQHFSTTGVLSVGWIDDTSFLVGIPHDNLELMSSVKQSRTCTVTPYGTYKASRESRKRSYEMIDRSQVELPQSTATTAYLNVNARPFVSRGNSPVPEELESEELESEDLGEVCSKRARIDEGNGESESTQLKKSYASVTKDAKETSTEREIFDVPEHW